MLSNSTKILVIMIVVFCGFSINAFAKVKIIKIARLDYISETIGAMNMTQTGDDIFSIIASKGSLFQYNRYNSGKIIGKANRIPDGSLIHGSLSETFHIEGEGVNAGFLVTLDLSILWKDDAGYTYTMEGTGFAKYPPRAFPIFFETGVVERPNFYEAIGGQFRTNNPDLRELNESVGVWKNNKFTILPDGTFKATADLYIVLDPNFSYGYENTPSSD